MTVFEDPDVTERGFDHALSAGTVVLRQEIFFERARVDADADGNLLVLGDVDDFLHELLAPDVAGVQTQPIDPLLQGGEGELVVEVNVGDEWDPDLALD